MAAPEGSVVNRTSPFPVMAGWVTQAHLREVRIKALVLGTPDRVGGK